jgi:Tol biopolymer transport system component
VVALAGAITVLLFGLLAWLLRSNEGAPVAVTPTTFISPTPTTGGDESSDLFTPIEGWIVYRSGSEPSELMAVDPQNPEDKRSLGPADNLLPLGWSADGSRLLLADRGPPSAQTSVQQSVGSDLYVMTADGSVEQVTSGGTSFGGSLSPSGNAVAYIDASENLSLFVSDTVGRYPPRVVATSVSLVWLGHPAWSPDGSQIAFVGYSEMGQSWSISLVNVDGTERRLIRDQDRLRVEGLAWSPDGSQLGFSGQEWDQSQGRSIEGVFVMDADGSEPRQLTNIEGVQTVHDCCSVAWSPDGSRIAFLRNSGLTDLFTVAADGTDEQEIEGVFVTADGTIAWHPGR